MTSFGDQQENFNFADTNKTNKQEETNQSMFSFNNFQNGAKKVKHFYVIFCEAKHVIQTKIK